MVPDRVGRGSLTRSFAAGAGGVAGRGILRMVLSAPAQRLLMRTNFRGSQVSLAGGPAVALGASVGAVLGAENARIATAAAVAGLGAGAVGLYDDHVGARPDQRAAKGFHGHLAALRRGQITAGMVKVAGVGAAGLAAAAILAGEPGRRRGVAGVLLDAGIIAGTANLINLLDLRPGRALKAGIAVGAPLAVGSGPGCGVAAGAVGAAAALLPDDLAERTMLGDGGANGLGALLGTALVTRAGLAGRVAAFAGIVGLTLASEKVSFTKVIDRTPGLRELDALGRRPS